MLDSKTPLYCSIKGVAIVIVATLFMDCGVIADAKVVFQLSKYSSFPKISVFKLG